MENQDGDLYRHKNRYSALRNLYIFINLSIINTMMNKKCLCVFDEEEIVFETTPLTTALQTSTSIDTK